MWKLKPIPLAVAQACALIGLEWRQRNGLAVAS